MQWLRRAPRLPWLQRLPYAAPALVPPPALRRGGLGCPAGRRAAPAGRAGVTERSCVQRLDGPSK